MKIPQSAFTSLDPSFSALVDTGKSPGVAYAITHRGQVVHNGSFGLLDTRATLPVERSSLFRIASMTKSFAAVAALRLRDVGVLDINAPLASINTGLRLAEPFASASLRELMAMKLDLPTDDPWADRLLEATTHEIDPFFAQPMLRAGLGNANCAYSNLSYILLGRIIAITSGRPAMEYISEEILRPLEMNATLWNIPEDMSTRAAIGYRADCEPRVEERHLSCRSDGVVFGGLWSTVDDLARWLEFLRAEESEPTLWDSVLSRTSRRELWQPYSSYPARTITSGITGIPFHSTASYGFGVVRYTIEGSEYIGHSGGLPGFGSHMRVHPRTGYGIIALGNGTYCPASDPCADGLHYVVSSLTPSIGELKQRIFDMGTAVADFLLSNAENDSSLFAYNVWQDNIRERFREDAQKKLLSLGDDVRVERVLYTSGFRGEVVFTGNHGTAKLEFQLTPFLAGQIQALSWISE